MTASNTSYVVSASFVAIASDICAVATKDKAHGLARQRAGLEAAITLAYSWQIGKVVHRMQGSPLKMSVERLTGNKTMMGKFLLPIVQHHFNVSVALRSAWQDGKRHDVASMVGDAMREYDEALAALEQATADKLAEAAIKRDTTKATKQAEVAKVEQAKEAEQRAIAERAETLAEQVTRLTAELDSIKQNAKDIFAQHANGLTSEHEAFNAIITGILGKVSGKVSGKGRATAKVEGELLAA